MAIAVSRWRGAARPDATFFSVRREVHDADLIQGGVITDNPTVVGILVAERRPRSVNYAVLQDKACAIKLRLRVKHGIRAKAAVGRRDINRSAKQLLASANVETVQTLKIVPVAIFAHCLHVDDPSGNDRSSRNADLPHNIAIHVIRRGLAKLKQHRLPENATVVSVTGIDTIVLRGNVDDIVRSLIWNRDAGN